jgi:hypothetical protein
VGNTWVDKDTNLMWQIDIDKTRVSFDEAQEYAIMLNNKNFEGYNDWRVPTVDELLSLGNIELYDRRDENQDFKWVDWYKNTKKDAFENQFSHTKISYIKEPLLDSMNMDWQSFWSSSSCDDDYAWMLVFGNGTINSYLKTGDMYVRCVRNGDNN